MGVKNNDPGNKTDIPGERGPKSSGPGVEEAVEPENVERPGNAESDRTRQMQNADESDQTRDNVESVRSDRSSTAPEVGLPSEVERRSDEL